MIKIKTFLRMFVLKGAPPLLRHSYIVQLARNVYHAEGSQFRGCQGERKMAADRFSCRKG